MGDPTFHALLIGADHYFENTLSNGASYRSLGGCVNDALRVEATLRERIKSAKLAITKLVAPNQGESRPAGDEKLWPTAANIRKALAELAERAQPGDQVYIHYSGHGGRVSTAWKDMKGADGIDEALVPIDIGVPDAPWNPPFTRPERYIRDVELALYLDRLANKVDEATKQRIVVTLVFDSCHSGGVTRGTEIAARCASGGAATAGDARGTLDRRELRPEGAPADGDHRRMAEAFARLRSEAPRAAAVGVSWLPPARGYVLLAACRDVESALEASLEGRPRGGILTDALLEALSAIGGDQTWKTIHDRILARIHGRFPSQTPQLLGELDRHVFGVELSPIELTLSVTEVDLGDRTVKLNAGLASTITRGTEVGIYRPGDTDFSLADRRVAVARVVQANDLDSLARLDDAAAPEDIQVGAPVVIQGLPLRRRVALLPRTDLPPELAARQDAALSAVIKAISTGGKGFLDVCPEGETPHYQVVVSPTGKYEICDPQGVPYRYLEPATSIDAVDGARAMIAKLRRLGRYQTVLEMTEPSSKLQDQIAVQLLEAPPGWDGNSGAPTSSIGGKPLESTGGCYSVKSDTWIWLRLTNTQPDRPVNVAVVGLDRKWHISILVPHPSDLIGKKYETLSDQPGTFAFQMTAPIPETLDVFKIFMTVGDVDFRLLATTAATTRSAHGVNALGRLIDAIDADEHRTRDTAPARSASAPWSVRELRVRTFQ
ncbi:caspase family protein [Sorangium sp. KYC3313]|uniref:caspase family protein n=1 Tax=Sorangium sp. KYC3313 TaxID=3449740 RepID=UPI003F8863AC